MMLWLGEHRTLENTHLHIWCNLIDYRNSNGYKDLYRTFIYFIYLFNFSKQNFIFNESEMLEDTHRTEHFGQPSCLRIYN